MPVIDVPTGPRRFSRQPVTAAAEVATLTLTNTIASARNGRVELFGHAFARGDVASGQTLRATVAGASAPLQTMRTSTWPDGSLQFGVFAVVAGDFTSSQSKTLTLNTGGSAPSGSNITLSNLPTDGSSNADLTLAAETITCNRTNLLAAGGELVQVFTGPHCAHWIYRPAYTSPARVYARFDIYAFREATTGAVDRVEYAGGNEVTQIRRDEADHGTVASSLNRFRVDSVNILSETTVLYQYSRWWEHDFDLDIHVIHDRDYLASTGVVWSYPAGFTVSSTAVTDYGTAYTGADGINQNGGWREDMSAGGTDPDIGPIPGQDACYLIGQSPTMRDTMLRMHQRWGRCQVHFWDEDQGRPVQSGPSAGQHAQDELNPDLGYGTYWGTFASASWTTAGTDVAHQPRCGFVPYLVTGRDWYREEGTFWASMCCANGSSAYINATDYNIMSNDQVRAEGWALCTVAVWAALNPDGDSMKTYFEGALARNIAYTWDDNYAPGQSGNTVLGAVGPQYPGPRSTLLGQDGFLISWQSDFVMIGAVWAWKLGYDGSAGSAADFSAYSSFLCDWVVGRCHKFGWQSAPLYWISLAGSALPTSWDEMRTDLYAENQASQEAFRPDALIPFDDTGELQIGEPGTATWRAAFASNLGTAEVVGFGTEPASDIMITMAALAAAVDRGKDGASEAWTDFNTLSNKPNTETGDITGVEGQPQFDLIPTTGFPHQVEPRNAWIGANVPTDSTWQEVTSNLGANFDAQLDISSYSGGTCGGGFIYVFGGGHNNGMSDSLPVLDMRDLDVKGWVEEVRSSADHEGVADTNYSAIGTYLNTLYDTADLWGGVRDDRGAVPLSRHTYDGMDADDEGTMYMYHGVLPYDNSGQPTPDWGTDQVQDLWRYRRGIGWDQLGRRSDTGLNPTGSLAIDRLNSDRLWLRDSAGLRAFTLSTGQFGSVVTTGGQWGDESFMGFNEDVGTQGSIFTGGSFGGSTWNEYDIDGDSWGATRAFPTGASTTSSYIFYVPSSRGANYGNYYCYGSNQGTLWEWNGAGWDSIATGGPSPSDFIYGRAGFDHVHQVFYMVDPNWPTGPWETWLVRPYDYETL